jgi:hypothetical protein
MKTPWFDPRRKPYACVQRQSNHSLFLRLFRWEKTSGTAVLRECHEFLSAFATAVLNQTSRPPLAVFRLANRRSRRKRSCRRVGYGYPIDPTTRRRSPSAQAVEGVYHPRHESVRVGRACSPPDCFGSRRKRPPKDWIDADTGHRVVRLTGDAGGSTLYFHDNAFSPEGDRLIVNTPDGIAMIDVAKIGTDAARLTR